jgi:hypothetical protein
MSGVVPAKIAAAFTMRTQGLCREETGLDHDTWRALPVKNFTDKALRASNQTGVIIR